MRDSTSHGARWGSTELRVGTGWGYITVIAAEDAETFELGPAEEEALLAAITEADRGDLADGGEVLATLRRRTRPKSSS